MTILFGTKQGSAYGNVMEDPDTSKSRIFIENMGMDASNLTPKFGEFWNFQDTTNQVAPNPQTNWYNYPPMVTNNGKWCWGPLSMYANQENWAAPGHMDPWMASLDYENIVGKYTLKTSSGLVCIGIHNSFSTNDSLMDWWIGSDMAGTPSYRVLQTSNHCLCFYEDPNSQDEFYAINYDNNSYSIGKMRFTGLGTTFTAIRSNALNNFFLGKNLDGSPMFVEVDGANNRLDVVRYPSSGSAIFALSNAHPFPSQWHYQFPSNVRTDDVDRKVFYQGGWDAEPREEYKKAVFTRFVWNPTTAEVVATPCTLSYPAGTNHKDYQRTGFYTAGNHAATRNAWFYKPHQFTVAGVNYITFLSIDRYNPNSATSRWYYYHNDKRNTWVTFSIGSGLNDNVLTYHSTFEWTDSSRQYPRYFCPLNEIGNQLLIIKNDEVSTITFDVVKGWYQHDAESISARSFCIDSVGRVFMTTTAYNSYYDTDSTAYDYGTARGYNIIHQYNYSVPTTISISFSTSTFVYAGVSLSANLIVDTRDYTGLRIATNIKLTISGGNMVFTDGSQSKTITTTSTTATIVSAVITGGGRPSITANIA
jgi:hypothetical protein